MNNETDHDDIDPVLVREALQAVLDDERFSSAPQMSAFLRYVVERTLAGEASRIKAYSVAVDALGKPETFDAQGDPSVRVLAVRLRSTMQEYYARTRGHKVFIRLRPGTYVPRFELADEGSAAEAQAIPAKEPDLRSSLTSIGGAQSAMGATDASEPAPRSSAFRFFRRAAANER